MNTEKKFSNPAKAIIAVLSIALLCSLFFLYKAYNLPQPVADESGTVRPDSGNTAEAAFMRSKSSGFTFPYFTGDDKMLDSLKVYDTDTIDPSLARICIDKYAMHGNALRMRIDSTTEEVVRGFRLNMRVIDPLLKKNPAYLFLEFGVKPELVNASSSRQEFTMIITGVDDQNNVIKAKNRELTYEYLKPCPPKCPAKSSTAHLGGYIGN